jgi:hypothetical protein
VPLRGVRCSALLGGMVVMGFSVHFIITYQLFMMSCARRFVVIERKPAS